MQFEKSSDTKILESVLHEVQVGELITYQKLSEAIGRDVKVHAMGALQTAKKSLLREKNIVFGTERGVGLVRLNAAGVVKSTEADRLSIHRKAEKSLRKLGAVNFDELSAEEKRSHVAYSAQLGAVSMFSHRTASNKIEARITDTTKPMAIGDTLRLFS